MSQQGRFHAFIKAILEACSASRVTSFPGKPGEDVPLGQEATTLCMKAFKSEFMKPFRKEFSKFQGHAHIE